LAVTREGRRILVAGINSGSRGGFNAAQLQRLREWGVNIAPQELRGEMGRGMEFHAEENIATYLQQIGARAERWSRAVVGEQRPSGSSYVCPRCQGLIGIRSVGGRVEEP
jgi:hypothetical protein